MGGLLQIHEKDNVATCLHAVKKGERLELDGDIVIAAEDIPAFHKLAVIGIPAGELCYKYGNVIGMASSDIEKGAHVHVHNLESTRGRGDKQTPPEVE